MSLPEFQMDALDRKANEAFPGYLVRKDLVRRYARQYPVPTYVVEFLLGRYCASVDQDEIDEGLEIVKTQLEGRTVRSAEQEVFKSRAPRAGLGAPDRHRAVPASMPRTTVTSPNCPASAFGTSGSPAKSLPRTNGYSPTDSTPR